MKYLKLLPVALILAFTVYLTSCSLIGFPGGQKAPDYITRADVLRMFPAIYADEPISYGLACQILEHDVTVFCLNPAAAPAGFPKELCTPGLPVCRQILGDPATSPAPQVSPAPPASNVVYGASGHP